MPALSLKVLGQLGVTCFEQGVVKGEAAILAGVERLGELHDGRGPFARGLQLIEGLN
jgi:hypothetical protein